MLTMKKRMVLVRLFIGALRHGMSSRLRKLWRRIDTLLFAIAVTASTNFDSDFDANNCAYFSTDNCTNYYEHVDDEFDDQFNFLAHNDDGTPCANCAR